MRHGRRTLLFVAEILFGFPDLCTLQMADFGGDFIQRAANYRQGCQIIGMAIALNHLRRARRSFDPEAGAHFRFQFRAQMRESAHRAREFADAHLFRGTVETFNVALHLGIPICQLEAERNRFGMDAMRTADHGRVFELPRAPVR